METWKEFDQNPLSHSAAHHLVAISELLEEYGYARVSDVARRLKITRGSASVTLKGLKQRGLVVEDERRFLGLSAEGTRFADGVRAKRRVLETLFVDLFGVPAEQADVDACKIEHLISNETARRAGRLLAFLQSGTRPAEEFLAALREQPAWSRQQGGGFPPREFEGLRLLGCDGGEARAPRAGDGSEGVEHDPR